MNPELIIIVCLELYFEFWWGIFKGNENENDLVRSLEGFRHAAQKIQLRLHSKELRARISFKTQSTELFRFHTLMIAKFSSLSSIPETFSSSLNAWCSFHCPRPHGTIFPKFPVLLKRFSQTFPFLFIKFKFPPNEILISLRMWIESIYRQIVWHSIYFYLYCYFHFTRLPT